jgi:hypothetical protein
MDRRDRRLSAARAHGGEDVVVAEARSNRDRIAARLVDVRIRRFVRHGIRECGRGRGGGFDERGRQWIVEEPIGPRALGRARVGDEDRRQRESGQRITGGRHGPAPIMVEAIVSGRDT